MSGNFSLISNWILIHFACRSGLFKVTFDFETVGDENTPADHCVTVRERDTMQQVRMPISEVKAYLREKCAF